MGRIIVLIIVLAVACFEPACAAETAPWQFHIAGASERFGIPENWIRAVIATESGGDPKAVSPRGAMGLMQLMPNTWDDMRTAYSLGPDPFDIHANILAGTAYLKAMYDRFGFPALFAAYNVGAARYEDFLRTGNPLPDETLTYTADIEKVLSGTSVLASNALRLPMQIASGTGLFFVLSATENAGSRGVNSVPPNDLFVRLSTRKSEEK